MNHRHRLSSFFIKGLVQNLHLKISAPSIVFQIVCFFQIAEFFQSPQVVCYTLPNWVLLFHRGWQFNQYRYLPFAKMRMANLVILYHCSEAVGLLYPVWTRIEGRDGPQMPFTQVSNTSPIKIKPIKETVSRDFRLLVFHQTAFSGSIFS